MSRVVTAETRALIPSNYLTNEGVLLEGFENIADWTNYGSSAAGQAIANNVTSFHAGSQSINFSATGTGTVRYNRYNAGGTDLSDVDTFSLWVDWERVSGSSNITIYLSSDAQATFANYKAVTIVGTVTGSTRADGGPICLTWQKKDMTTSAGSLDWSNITNVNILCNMQGAGESCNLDSLYVGRRTRSKLVLCFDDGVENVNFSQLTHAGVALSYGIPVSLMVIPRLVNGAGYLTTAQLTTLKSNGHLISGHSDVDGLGDYPTAGWTSAQVEADIKNTIGFLNTNGFSDGVPYFAWPSGEYAGYTQAASNAGVVSARSITAIVQTNNEIEKLNLGIIDPMVLNASAMTGTPANLLASVDKAISNGTSILFYVHKISTGAATPAGYEITGNDFETFCQGVQDRTRQGSIDPVLYNSFYETYV